MDIDENLTKSVICGDVDKRKMIIMYIIAIAMIISYICSPLPIAVTAICAALLCIITGCCSFKNVVSELNWESIIFLASCLGLAEAITTAGTGELIGNFVFSLIGNISSPIAIFAILVILTLFISQFITNSTAIIITLPLALSLCKVYGFNPMAFCIGITIAASIACCTPLAASQIAMTQVAGYKFTDYLKYCLKPTLLLCAVTIITVPMFYPLTV